MAGARHRNVFFDVLGTLLTEDEVPRPRAREAFLRLKGEGHELYLWSSGGAGYAAGAAAACEHRKNWPADTLEQATRQYVLNLLGNPEVMRRQVEPVVQKEIAALRNP